MDFEDEQKKLTPIQKEMSEALQGGTFTSKGLAGILDRSKPSRECHLWNMMNMDFWKGRV